MIKRLLLCAATALMSCRSAPPPDASEEYRHILASEVGPFRYGNPDEGADAAPEVHGPAVLLYRKSFGYDDYILKTGVIHGMGYLIDAEPELGVQYFIPPARADVGRRGTVFLTAGFLDNTGRFRPIVELITAAGFSVVAFDLPGHGFSGGNRGEIGQFEDYGRAVGRVMDAFLDIETGSEEPVPDAAAAETPAPLAAPAFPRPWIAAGHSMGATSFYIYLNDSAERGLDSPFDRVVFLNPLIRSAYWRISMIGLSLFGWAAGSLEPWNDPDPLLGNHSFSVSWLKRLRDWNREAVEYKPIRQRCLIIQGRKDDVVDFHYNVRFLKERIPGTEVRYVVDAHHVPYSEEEGNTEVLRYLMEYLGSD